MALSALVGPTGAFYPFAGVDHWTPDQTSRQANDSPTNGILASSGRLVCSPSRWSKSSTKAATAAAVISSGLLLSELTIEIGMIVSVKTALEVRNSGSRIQIDASDRCS
jgi:hypothetical protein